MRALKRGLAMTALLSGAALGADDPALAALEACRARLDPRTDIGFERIAARCPDLKSALESAPWYALLPGDLEQRRNDISAESLRELAALVRASQGETTARAAPDVKRLAPVLEGLGEQGEEGATRWERFKRWMQDKLQKRAEAENDEDESWLQKLRRQFETSEGVAQAITVTGYVLMAVLVMLVIWSELRAAGLLGRGRGAARMPDPRSGWRRPLQLADVMAAPLADRPGLLLRMIGESLSRAHRLPAPDGLTASAIARRAQLDEEADRAELERLAVTADAVRYSPRPPASERLEDAATSARSLLARFLKLRRAR